jgi:hypothetical protein
MLMRSRGPGLEVPAPFGGLYFPSAYGAAAQKLAVVP